MYRVTVDDPSMFTRPWTIEIPLTKQSGKENLIFETACHEGNYALTSILAGARLEEAPRDDQGREPMNGSSGRRPTRPRAICSGISSANGPAPCASTCSLAAA